MGHNHRFHWFWTTNKEISSNEMLTV